MSDKPNKAGALGTRQMQDAHRERIKTGNIINRLQKQADGEIEMTPQQLKACEILLKKTLPDLKQVEHSGDVNMTAKVIYLDKEDKDA